VPTYSCKFCGAQFFDHHIRTPRIYCSHQCKGKGTPPRRSKAHLAADGGIEFIEANSIPEPNSGCWLWLRGVRGAYPVWIWNGRQTPVSHLSLKTKGIEVPKGREACHRCDVKLCVNPDHLFVGTHFENVQDYHVKRRARSHHP